MIPSSQHIAAPSADVSTSAREAALAWLLSRINYERTSLSPYLSRQLKLDRMRQLLARLGQPDAGMKIVHVAGTKGKGSTSAMIAAMLTAAGYRTGVFSSPHLERIEERFAVDGLPCSPDELVTLIDRIRPEVRAMDEEAAAAGETDGGPTYFEITTAMAFLHFVERQVDAAVLEVGLGGRLDSTNVCLPLVSVVTSISFDHMRQLGNTLSAIAREKAGIIKPGVPVVCGVTDAEPLGVIAEIAREHGCRLIQVGNEFGFEYHAPAEVAERSILTHEHGAIDFTTTIGGQPFELRRAQLAMRGRHQAANAALALATVAELRHQGWCISVEAMRAGLSQAVLPGRVEIVPSEPTVILDAAHNPASARALIETLVEHSQPARRTVILAVSSDKDAAAIAHELTPHFDRFLVTQYQNNARAFSADTLAEIIRGELDHRPAEVAVLPTPAQAWNHAVQSAVAGETICITGSFFLIAEMRPLVLAAYATDVSKPAR